MTISCSSNSVFLKDLHQGYLALFKGAAVVYWESFAGLAPAVLAAIASSDAPYHNLEHTQQVLTVGQALLQGKHHCNKALSPRDWLNVMVALLCHDVGYVRGLCTEDDRDMGRYSTGHAGQVVEIPQAKTDACLAPYHVDRSQQFVLETLRHHPLIDLETVLACIEITRFPVPEGGLYQDTVGFPGLCRVADLVGQLSDPHYLQKLPTLYCEFEETGMAQAWGYQSPADLRASYPHFYWAVVFPYIRDGLRFLAATKLGRQIIARLYTNVYLVELEEARTDITSDQLKQQFAQNRLELYPHATHPEALSFPSEP
ncbi:MAG TPA: metal-dependent phosphohydrolase [Trichocoleus sp.]